MNKQFSFSLPTAAVFAGALMLSSAHAKEEKKVDPYMGDWVGKVATEEGDLKAHIRMIALGRGQYKARVFSTFMSRADPEVELTGTFRGDTLEMLDVPLTGASIKEFVDGGFVVAGSFVSG